MRGNPTCRELFFLCTAASKSWNPHGKFPFKVAESAVHRRPLRAPPSLLHRKCQRGEIDKKKKRRRFCARASCVSMFDCTKLNMRGDGWTHADRLQRAGPQFPSSALSNVNASAFPVAFSLVWCCLHVLVPQQNRSFYSVFLSPTSMGQ